MAACGALRAPLCSYTVLLHTWLAASLCGHSSMGCCWQVVVPSVHLLVASSCIRLGSLLCLALRLQLLLVTLLAMGCCWLCGAFLAPSCSYFWHSALVSISLDADPHFLVLLSFLSGSEASYGYTSLCVFCYTLHDFGIMAPSCHGACLSCYTGVGYALLLQVLVALFHIRTVHQASFP